VSSVAASGVGAAEQGIQRSHCLCPNSDNDGDPASSLSLSEPDNCSVSHTDFFSHEVWKHVMLATVTASLANVSCCLAAAKGRSRVLAMLLLVARPPRRPLTGINPAHSSNKRGMKGSVRIPGSAARLHAGTYATALDEAEGGRRCRGRGPRTRAVHSSGVVHSSIDRALDSAT
jgi:hypothetical protein